MAEQYQQSLSYVDMMREKRWAAAESAALGALRSLAYGADQISQPVGTLAKMDPAYSTDMGILSPSDLVAFDAIGMDVAVIAGGVTRMNSGESIAEKTLDDGTEVAVHALGGERSVVSVHLAPDSPIERAGWALSRRSKLLNDVIKKRFSQSPAHQSLHMAAEQATHIDATTQHVSLEPFSPRIDPLGTLAFFSGIGFPVDTYHSTGRAMARGETPAQVLEGLLQRASQLEQTVNHDGSMITEWESSAGVKTRIFYDTQDDKMTVTFAGQPERYYAEKANQSSEMSTPFIETKCFEELSAVLARHNLGFSPALEEEMLSTNQADRYGSVYTQISRELARWVNSPTSASPHKLFALQERDSDASAGFPERDEMSIDEVDQRIKDVLTEISLEGLGEASRALLDLAQQALSAPRSGTTLPLTQRPIDVTKGACFDVTGYYVSAALETGRQGIAPIEVAGVPMLEKNIGAHTYMLTEETLFNGVRLPKGALMGRLSDEGWAFLRLTSFTFDSEDDKQVFDAEIRKAVVNNELRAGRKLGEVSLRFLTDSARTPAPRWLWNKRKRYA